MASAQQSSEISARTLLLLLGEELKSSLVSITQLAELKQPHDDIRITAQQSLRTIDTILLYQRISSGQQQLALEPVHVGSTLHDVAYIMKPMAKLYGCEVDVEIQHGLQPIDVDRQVLSAGLQSLWQAFLGTLQLGENPLVHCRAYKSNSGVRVSLTSSSLQTDKLSLVTKSTWSSRQPLKDIAGPAADVLAAKGMFELLGSTLRKTKIDTSIGLGVTFPASKQLQMVV